MQDACLVYLSISFGENFQSLSRSLRSPGYVVVVYLMPVRSTCTDPRRRLWAGSKAWTDARQLTSRQRQLGSCSTATPYAMFLQPTGRLSNHGEVSPWRENPGAATSTT